MAFSLVNGYDVELASSKIVYENLMPEIQHIDGKGVTDKYTMTDAVESVNSMDIMRVLPQAPKFRQLGSRNNGGWHNVKNEGGFNNAPQSVHYTVAINLVYDNIVPIYDTQDYSNPINLQAVVMGDLVKTLGTVINTVTYAKQLEAFFKDNFTKGASEQEQIDTAVFPANKALHADESGSYADAFLGANSALTDGIPEIGAFVVPADERQAFVTTNFNRIVKRQYMQNASEASAEILASGFMNPFNKAEGKRINASTGLCGMYDGVNLFIINNVTKTFVIAALGLKVGTDDTEINLLNQIQAVICYAGATLRGIVGPSIEVNKNPYGRGIIVAPYLKMGVECISGKGIKVVVDGVWTTTNIDALTAKVAFTPIDGVTVTGDDLMGEGVFNDGTSN